jgi:hypothetical protein
MNQDYFNDYIDLTYVLNYIKKIIDFLVTLPLMQKWDRP